MKQTLQQLKKIMVCCLVMISAASYANEHLPTSIDHNGDSYALCDDYMLKYGFVIKVAAIGWYAEDCQQLSSVLASNNKILRFHYFRDVEASFFQDSAAEYFVKNLGSEKEKTAMKITLSEFNDAYTNINPGEYFDLIHYQNQTLSLMKNGTLLTTTDNSAFARLYFNIWFGQNPVIKRLKEAFTS